MKSKLTYHVYRPGQPVEHAETEWDGRFSDVRGLINKLVEGELEQVGVLFNGKRADMFVEANSSDGMSSFNEEANKIYYASLLSRNPRADNLRPRIFGVAVVFDEIVWR